MLKVNFFNKLIIFSLCLLLPLTIFSYYLISEIVSRTKNELINSTLVTADIVRSNIDVYMEDTKRLLMTLAQNSIVQKQNEREVMGLFVDSLSANPSLLNLFAAGEDGKIYAYTAWYGDNSKDIYGNPEFQQVMQTGRPFMSKRINSKATGQMAVSIMVPVISLTRVTGVIGAEISVKELQQSLIGDANLNSDSQIAITDKDGVVLIHSNYRNVYEETNLSGFIPFQLAIKGDKGIIPYQESKSADTYWGAYLPTNSFNGAVIVTIPDSVMQPVVSMTMRRWVMALIPLITFVILLSVSFANYITRPIKKLTHFTQSMDMNNLRCIMELNTKDELDLLADAFNVMSGRLADQMENLASANDEIASKKDLLRKVLSNLVYVQEEERGRIAADIHDGVTQMIVGALFETKAVLNLTEKNNENEAKLKLVAELLSETIIEMQRIINHLRPPLLEDLGLLSALRLLATRLETINRFPVSLIIQGNYRKMDALTEVIIYRIVQEATQNALKHSNATLIKIKCTFSDTELAIKIKDNGCGFRLHALANENNYGFGLLTMHERARAIGGYLKIFSEEDEGTEVRLTVPIENEDHQKRQLRNEGRL